MPMRGRVLAVHLNTSLELSNEAEINVAVCCHFVEKGNTRTGYDLADSEPKDISVTGSRRRRCIK